MWEEKRNPRTSSFGPRQRTAALRGTGRVALWSGGRRARDKAVSRADLCFCACAAGDCARGHQGLRSLSSWLPAALTTPWFPSSSKGLARDSVRCGPEKTPLRYPERQVGTARAQSHWASWVGQSELQADDVAGATGKATQRGLSGQLPPHPGQQKESCSLSLSLPVCGAVCGPVSVSASVSLSLPAFGMVTWLGDAPLEKKYQ